jgi:hypothetical protein
MTHRPVNGSGAGTLVLELKEIHKRHPRARSKSVVHQFIWIRAVTSLTGVTQLGGDGDGQLPGSVVGHSPVTRSHVFFVWPFHFTSFARTDLEIHSFKAIGSD